MFFFRIGSNLLKCICVQSHRFFIYLEKKICARSKYRFCRNLVLANMMALAGPSAIVTTPWQDSQLRAKEVLELLEDALQAMV